MKFFFIVDQCKEYVLVDVRNYHYINILNMTELFKLFMRSTRTLTAAA